MDIHENARLTPRGREHIVRLVQSGQALSRMPSAPAQPARSVLDSGEHGATLVIQGRNYP
jgi:hypothetical protein